MATAPFGPVWMRIIRSNATITKDIGYSFDAEGKLASVQYPDVAKPFTYFYDAMGRPNRMTGVGWDQNTNTANTIDHVNGVSYGIGGELLGMTYLASDPMAQETDRYFGESRSYNSRLQLTRQTAYLGIALATDVKYNFSATANDGRIESRENVVSGEAVSYLYDSLNRLVKAEQTAGPGVTPPPNPIMWGYDYVYDGFGNRWNQTIMNGKAGIPSTVQFNQSLNRILGQSYDANGNMTGGLTYDVDNRLLTASNEQYGYLADNKRFWKGVLDAEAGTYSGETYYLYGVGGQRIMSYPVTTQGGVLIWGAPKLDVAFGGRVIRLNGVGVVQDRLGSVVTRSNGTGVPEQHRYYPYGEEVGAATTGDRNKFGTYHRDQTGLDYADQRYYTNSLGIFATSDPRVLDSAMTETRYWARYQYALGDPANHKDSKGLVAEEPNIEFCLLTDRFEPVGQCETPFLPIAPTGPFHSMMVCNTYVTSQPVFEMTQRHTAIVFERAIEYSDGSLRMLNNNTVYDSGPQLALVGALSPPIILLPVTLMTASITDTGRYRNALREHGAKVEWESGFSASMCLTPFWMDGAARGVSDKNYLYLLLTSNSNAFTSHLLGVGGISIRPPANSPGWGSAFIGLPPGTIIAFRGPSL